MHSPISPEHYTITRRVPPPAENNNRMRPEATLAEWQAPVEASQLTGVALLANGRGQPDLQIDFADETASGAFMLTLRERSWVKMGATIHSSNQGHRLHIAGGDMPDCRPILKYLDLGGMGLPAGARTEMERSLVSRISLC